MDFSLAFDSAEPNEGGTFDRQREVALPARIMARVTDVKVALVFKVEPCRVKRGRQPFGHFAGDGAGSGGVHRAYI